MKFKEIKPGMVVHCPKEEDARVLLEHLDSLGYVWDNFRRDRISNDTHYEVYKENTCYKISLSNKAITYGEPDCESEAGYEITEFSDLIEPESRFKVGDKVRVRSDLEVGGVYGRVQLLKSPMADCRGTSATIIEIKGKNCYLLDNNPFNWSEEMLEPVDDSPINSPTDSPMTAEKALKWIREGFINGCAGLDNRLREVFNTISAEDILTKFTVEEIIAKITAYEAAKKAPKPVKVEWVKLFRIIQIRDNGTKKCVYEEETNPYVAYGTGEEGNYSFDPKYGAENLLKKYISEHDGRYIAVIEEVCRVKEDES